MSGDACGRESETCDVLENDAVETETFSSFEVEYVATSVVEEASCEEGKACGGEGGLWESARP